MTSGEITRDEVYYSVAYNAIFEPDMNPYMLESHLSLCMKTRVLPISKEHEYLLAPTRPVAGS